MRVAGARYFIITSGIVILSVVLVLYSSRKQSLTNDETCHYFCGLEWWQEGTYTAWPENPVLSRAVVGLGPYLDGYRVEHFAPLRDKLSVNDRFIYTYQHDYFKIGAIKDRVFWARIFVLPLFLISIATVWFWTHRLSGPKGALLAVTLYALNPIIMAHSGLATTDITFLACYMILLYAFFAWLRNPSVTTGLALGFGLALSMLAKYSTIPFFAGSMIVILSVYFWSAQHDTNFWRWLKRVLPTGALSVFCMSILIWAFHGFSFGSIGAEPVIKTGIETGEFPTFLQDIPVPAPEWFAGLVLIIRHNLGGQMAYAAEMVSTHGFWGFYPLAYILKTPITFMILTLLGFWGVLRAGMKNNWEITSLLLIPFALIFLGTFSNINLGIRHLAIIYAIGAIGGAAGTMILLKNVLWKYKGVENISYVSLIVFSIFIAMRTYPNYLSYFNFFAGREPGKYLVDSDLDWGQGLFQLSDFCRQNKIDTLNFAYFGGAEECSYDLPFIKLLPENQPVKGWVAVSEQLYRGLFTGIEYYSESNSCCPFLTFRYWDQDEIHRKYRWLDSHKVIDKVGGSIRIYFVE